MSYISQSLRQIVIERAKGCCEYCLLSQSDTLFPHEIDHIISEKHGGQTTEGNLCLSCLPCNKDKGSDIGSIDPVSNDLTRLFDPRTQMWNDHFLLEGSQIVALTANGRVTIRLLNLNSVEQVERREMLLDIQRYPCPKE